MTAESTTATVARNSLWYGAETAFDAIVLLVTSVVVARYLGPERLGELVFLNFIASCANRLGGIGISSATLKYMSECLALGKGGLAAGIYRVALHWQSALGIFVSVVGGVVAWFSCAPENRLTAILLLASIIPSLITWVPSQANTALQEMYRNSPSSFANSTVYALSIGVAVWLRLGTAGVAFAFLAGRVTELVLRIIATNRRMQQFETLELPAELRKRMQRYALQGLALTVLAIVVWDRSEIVFLKIFADNSQLAFYSLGFSLAAKLLVLPSVFATASSASLMVSCSADSDSAKSIFANSARYLALFVFPACLGAAVVCPSALTLIYGIKYEPAVPAAVICMLFAAPRAFESLPETVLQARDRQDFILKWMGVVTVANILLDLSLIPRYGSVGAAVANGLAQAAGVAGLAWKAREAGLKFPVLALARVAVSASIMAAGAALVLRLARPAVGLPLAIGVGIVLFSIMLRATAALSSEDAYRLRILVSRLPEGLRSCSDLYIRLISGSRAPAVEAEVCR